MASLSVLLNSHKMEKALEFYKALGFTVTHESRAKSGEVAYADLDLDGAEISLANAALSDDPEFREWVGTPLGAGVLVYVGVDDVDAVHEKARAAGAVVEYPPTDRPYGRVCGLNDPDGYVLTFIRES